MDDSKVAIFVCSPNSYSDVLKIFIECKNKNWPDCPYDFILATNNQFFHSIKVFNNNKANDGWTDRALPVLESLDYEYIILLADDAFISKSIDTQQIRSILETMSQEQILFCRLKHYAQGKKLQKNPLLSFLNKRTPYGLNLHKGIFKREYLCSLLGDGSKSCWQLEIDWNRNASKQPNSYYSDHVACVKEVIPTIHGLEKGAYFPSAINKLKKMGINATGTRKKMSVFKECLYDIKTGLGNFLPPEIRHTLKLIMIKFGVNFTTDN